MREHGARQSRDPEKQLSVYLFFGFLAHGYAFLNFQPSHDSLTEMISNPANWNWKIQLGRYLKPVYDMVFGYFTSFPWIDGIVALAWLSFAAYLATEMLHLSKKTHIALACGILTTNYTVIALTATYAQDLASNMLALTLAMLGSYIWQQYTERIEGLTKRTVVGYEIVIGCCLAASMALYQAFLFVYITMVLLLSILKCLEEPKLSFKKLWTADFLAAGSAGIGAILYYGGLKLSARLTGISLIENNYNSVSNAWTNTEPFLSRVKDCLCQFIVAFGAASGYTHPHLVSWLINMALCLLGVVCFFGLVADVHRKKASVVTIISAFVFSLLLPFAMDGARLLNSSVHVLMIYACWLSYVFIYVVAIRFAAVAERKWAKHLERLTAVLLCCLIFLNIQSANAFYVKKTTEQEATLSVMTRIVDKVEDLEGYEPGITPVAFIGTPAEYLQTNEAFAELSRLVGMNDASAITYEGTYKSYIAVMMKVRINLVKESVARETLGEDFIGAMPAFPAKGSIQMEKGIVVVKF